MWSVAMIGRNEIVRVLNIIAESGRKRANFPPLGSA
jgi:hypothetical protein